MSTITRERIAGIAGGEKCYTHDDVVELARIALASLEADAVAYVDPFAFHNFSVYRAGETDNKRMGREWMWANPDAGLIPVYTAPPAPVSVPDFSALDRLAGEMLTHAMNCERRVSVAYTHCAHRLAEEVRDLRAAMLHGAEPVTTGYKLPFEQWLSQQTGTIDVECGCVMTEVFFHWLRVAYEAGNSPVIPDGWVACSERMPDNDDFVYIWPRPDFGVELHVAQYGKFDRRHAGWYAQLYEQNFGIEYHPITVTHWMPLPSAPQQEAKNV